MSLDKFDKFFCFVLDKITCVKKSIYKGGNVSGSVCRDDDQSTITPS